MLFPALASVWLTYVNVRGIVLTRSWIYAGFRYCEADDRWIEAVKFLDLDDGAGWQLLQVLSFSIDYLMPDASAFFSMHHMYTGEGSHSESSAA